MLASASLAAAACGHRGERRSDETQTGGLGCLLASIGCTELALYLHSLFLFSDWTAVRLA